MAHKCMELRLRDPSGLHLGTLNFIGAPRHLALSACEDEAEGDIRRQPMRKSMVADSRESSDVSGPAPSMLEVERLHCRADTISLEPTFTEALRLPSSTESRRE